MRLPEYYLSHASEIDLSNCNNIPDAPRVAGATSSAETSSKREGRSAVAKAAGAAAPEKAAKKKKSKKSKSGERTATSTTAAAGETSKIDKSFYAMIGKKISTEQVILIASIKYHTDLPLSFIFLSLSLTHKKALRFINFGDLYCYIRFPEFFYLLVFFRLWYLVSPTFPANATKKHKSKRSNSF